MTEINNSNIQQPNDEISLKELILKMKEWVLYLKSKWLIITLAALLGATFGFAYAFFQKPTYTASLSFALEDEKSGGGLSGALGIASSLGFDLGSNAGGAFSGANLIELMKSRFIVEKALLNEIGIDRNKTTLAEFYLNFSALGVAVKKKESLSNIHYLPNIERSSYSLQKDSLLGIIYQHITERGGYLSVAQRDKKVSIINVDVATENELFSKLLTESIVKEVSEFYINTKSKKARTNVAILQKQADSIRIELNSAITGVAQASDNTFNLNPALNIRRVPSTHRQVDVQANTAILTQLVTNLELAKVTLLKETPLIQIIDKPILPLKKEREGKLKSLIIWGFVGSFSAAIYLIGKVKFMALMKD